jgi:hypothetical protein
MKIWPMRIPVSSMANIFSIGSFNTLLFLSIQRSPGSRSLDLQGPASRGVYFPTNIFGKLMLPAAETAGSITHFG